MRLVSELWRQVSKAFVATSTAASIVALVAKFTLALIWPVAGLYTSPVRSDFSVESWLFIQCEIVSISQPYLKEFTAMKLPLPTKKG